MKKAREKKRLLIDPREIYREFIGQRPARQSRAIAHAYATSPGLAWGACFFISIFDGQTVRMKNTRSMQVRAM
jgi:hypothetical protein